MVPIKRIVLFNFVFRVISFLCPYFFYMYESNFFCLVIDVGRFRILGGGGGGGQGQIPSRYMRLY